MNDNYDLNSEKSIKSTKGKTNWRRQGKNKYSTHITKKSFSKKESY